MAGFKKSLGIGALGEVIYYSAIMDDYIRSDGRRGDFVHRHTGEKLELKTDTYSMSATPNFFMEQYSIKHQSKLGGPFQAQQNGCKVYSYFYVQDMTVFTFNTDELVDKLNQLTPQLSITEVPNTAWITTGFLVNRDLLKDIYKVQKLDIKLKEV